MTFAPADASCPGAPFALPLFQPAVGASTLLDPALLALRPKLDTALGVGIGRPVGSPTSKRFVRLGSPLSPVP